MSPSAPEISPAWRTKLKEKEGVDDNHHMLPALEDLETPRAKVVLRPGPGKAEHQHDLRRCRVSGRLERCSGYGLVLIGHGPCLLLLRPLPLG